jgi:mediator of RNA polymerase II transcription subunit 14
MRNLTIENGYVTFNVANEFEASLTLTGDGPTVPWFVVYTRILRQSKFF